MEATIRERLERVRERIAQAALRAGRPPESVQLVAVSKKKPAADIVAAYEAGQRHFGESYVQEFQAKRAELPALPGAYFHFIGALQSNKTRLACGLFDVIQTVSSVKTARRLEEQSERPLDVFIEVKLSEEDSKSGAALDDAGELAEFLRGCDRLRLRGLMTMPPWSEDPETARPYFRKLRGLSEALDLAELSMGMSGDLEVAVEEGSTLVRIGTAIFGKRTP